ncbi:MAG: phenylacetate--CoA ligase [Deltaproteobacteria bacterium]|nr:phenylacetate--CoA ligase [Deltaproteobacteria bacterium]
MIWNEKFETLSRQELEELQLTRLRKVVERAYTSNSFYKAKFDERGVKPDHIKSLKDLQNIPFTTKKELVDNYPYGVFCAPLNEVVRIHGTSGTTGRPIVVGYTRNDIETWSELMARALTCTGIQKGDIIQNAYGYGLFTGGLGVHYGGEKIGATVIPLSGGNSRRQITVMKDLGSTALTCTPSYATYLAELAEEMGFNPAKDFKLKMGCFGAEPWSENMRAIIEKKFNIDAIDIYGLSEVIGPGVSIECPEGKHGLHIFEDHFLPEIIDPQTEEPLPYGEKGELVFTTITKEAFPVIRYRTRDITSLHPQTCVCGRTMVRMARITGRSDDMLIIRGVNLFPSQVESVLMEIEGVEPHYNLIVDREGTLDTLEVQVEISEKIFSDEVKQLENIEHSIVEEIKETLGVTCRVKLVEPKTIQRSEGKAKRVIDKRQI